MEQNKQINHGAVISGKEFPAATGNLETLDEEKTKEVVMVFQAFNFCSMAREKKVEFIKKMFGVNVIEEETEKKEEWLAQLVLARIEMNKPCPQCYGAGCAECYQTGKKRK